MVLVPGYGSWVPGEGSQVEGSRSRVPHKGPKSRVLAMGPGSRVPGRGSWILGPSSQVWVLGPGCHFSSVPFWTGRIAPHSWYSYIVTNAGHYIMLKLLKVSNAVQLCILKWLKVSCSNASGCSSTQLSFSRIIAIWMPIVLKNTVLLCWM